MTCIEKQGPCTRLLSFSKENGAHFISLIAKRTYLFEPQKPCVLSLDQEPLREKIETDPQNPELVLHDMDLYPYKPTTDMIVQGHAYAMESSREYIASVSTNNFYKAIQVFGKRKCWRDRVGKLRFTSPEESPRVRLDYTNAYGGIDKVAHQKNGHPLQWLMENLPPSASLFSYPRNPYGLGYVVENHPETFQEFFLPHLEHAQQKLTPENILVGDPHNWYRMPLPYTTNWHSPSFFPRTLATGILPKFNGKLEDFTEVKSGILSVEDLRKPWGEHPMNFGLCCGGSLGFSLPNIHPNQTIVMVGLHERFVRYEIDLPNDLPQMFLQNDQGKLIEIEPSMHTVLIEADQSRLTIVWRGALRVSRPYYEEELIDLPFKAIW